MAPPTTRAARIGPSARASVLSRRAPASRPPTDAAGSTAPGTVVSATAAAHHELADLALHPRRVVEDARHAPAVEHGDAVAQREQLLELGGDDDRGDAVGAHRADPLADAARGADVEA